MRKAKTMVVGIPLDAARGNAKGLTSGQPQLLRDALPLSHRSFGLRDYMGWPLERVAMG